MTQKGANLTCTILHDLFQKGLLSETSTLVLQWDGSFTILTHAHSCTLTNVHTCSGASENVAKTNLRFSIWLLMRVTGLLKINLSRLDVGHTHFEVDQRAAVFSISIRRGGSALMDVHSLSQYESCARKAHKDLRGFTELGQLFDFDTWLQPMRCRIEEGIQVCVLPLYQVLTHVFACLLHQDHLVIEFERIGEEIFVRSKPHMGLDVPFSARRLCWPPPPHTTYRDNPNPFLPNRNPPLKSLQVWKNYKEIRVCVPTPNH